MDRHRQTEIDAIYSYRNEDYPIWNVGRTYYGTKKFQVGWARISVEKFTERIRFLINGGRSCKDSVPELKKAVNNAVWFGNSTLIFDRSSGNTRISDPRNSWAEEDVWGNSSYFEELSGARSIVGINGDLWLVEKDREPVDLNSSYHSIFFRADDSNPSGQSRLTPAARVQINLKSTNLLRREITADKGSFPPTFISGLWEDIDPGVGESVVGVLAGTNALAGLPENPFTGEKLDVLQLPQVSPEPLLRHDSQIARDFASIMNLAPFEFGEGSGNPASEGALNAQKDSLILEVIGWEEEIKRSLTSYLSELAVFWDEADPVLNFANAALVTQSAKSDSAVKMASIYPQYRLSRAGAEEAGIGEATLIEMFDEDDAPFAIEEENDEI